jgi:hypothetical protein
VSAAKKQARSRTGRRSRQKGAVGERELVNLAKAAGFTAAERTAPMQAFKGDLLHPDVARVGRIWAENKRHRRVNVQAEMKVLLATERPGYVRVLFHRDDGGPPLATLEAHELLKLEKKALEAETWRFIAENEHRDVGPAMEKETA